MPRHLFKRWTPSQQKIQQYRMLQIFGNWHLDPNLWHFNRNSVATAFSVGLFTAFMPVPFHMIIAAALAILFRANLPVAVLLVWVTNPFTIPPIFFCSYKLGSYLLSIAPEQLTEGSLWRLAGMKIGKIWKPVMIGLFTLAITSAVLSNIIVRLLWRIHVNIRWRNRR